MKDESKIYSLTSKLTTGVAFLRVHSRELCDRAGRSIVDFLHSLSRPQRIAFKAAVTACLAFLFIYSWIHPLQPEYFVGGERNIPLTLPLGMVLLVTLASLLWELIGRE
jgi:hypothetical protein